MISLSAQSTADILLIRGTGGSVMRWEKGRLGLQTDFSAEADQQAAFRHYLDARAMRPFIIVADLIEEDFRNETIAHTRGSDRAALLKRKLSYLFRSTDYRTARVTGREAEGRRDDKVLFSALTRPELLEPWVDTLLARKGVIQSITSAAYLMELLARSMKLSAEPQLLLVSLEGNRGLRHTYMQKGFVLFSRLTPLGVGGGRSLVDLLRDECGQTRKYLERIKLLPYDEPLDVRVVAADIDAEVDFESLQSPLMLFSYCDTSAMPAQRSISVSVHDEQEGAGAIALSLAETLRRKAPANIYAPPAVRRYAYLKSAARSLVYCSALALLTTVGLIVPGVFETLGKQDQQVQFKARSQPLMQDLEQRRENFPATPLAAAPMELVVQTYDKVRAQALNPQQAMQVISQALSMVPEISLARIDWQLQPLEDEAVEDVWSGYGQPDPREEFLKAVIAEQTVLKTTLTGMVAPTDSHRLAQNQVLAFIEALRSLEGVTVQPLTMPTDVRPATEVAARLDGISMSPDFVLEIAMVAAP